MIRLIEILSEIQNYQIFVDMDGVLVDFVNGYKKTMGELPPPPAKGDARTEFWKNFQTKISDKGMTEREYWASLPWMSDGKALWSYLKPYKPIILSAPSKNPESVLGKKDWLKVHLSSPPAIIQYNKDKYAKPNRILIDDRKDFIDKWTAKGGIGILHKNTSQTIKKLKELGF